MAKWQKGKTACLRADAQAGNYRLAVLPSCRLLLLIYHRREPGERAQLTEIVQKSVQTRRRQEEVNNMGRTIAQALIEEGEQRGIERGQVKSTQSSTLDVLTARFSVPSPTLTDLKERVQRIENLSVLQRLHIDAVKVDSLDDFIKRLDELQP